MSARTFDVLPVLESDAHCARESRERHYDIEVVELTHANSTRAIAAIRELIDAAQAFNSGTDNGRRTCTLDVADRFNAAILACKGE